MLAERSAHAAISASTTPVPRARSATNRSFITPTREALSVDQVQKIVAKPIGPAFLVAGDQLRALAIGIGDQRSGHREQGSSSGGSTS